MLLFRKVDVRLPGNKLLVLPDVTVGREDAPVQIVDATVCPVQLYGRVSVSNTGALLVLVAGSGLGV